MTFKEATLERFLPSTNKISYVCAHHVQPWIALVDKNSGAQIWNWQSGEIIYTAQFGGIDESAMHYHSLQKMAEVDPAYWGAKTAQEQSVSKTPSGKLKMIEFMDVETLYWERVRQLSIIKPKSVGAIGSAVPGGISVQKERWVVFVCENKILFHELLSHKSRELSRGALDLKNPTCIAVLSGTTSESFLDDAFLAVGCSDGTLRLVAFSSFKTVVKLGYRSPPVTCLRALHRKASGCMLVSGSHEGTLCLWDPFPSVAAAGASLSPITTANKAHDGEILSISLGFGSPYGCTPSLFTLGVDRSIGIYDVDGLKSLTKFRCPSHKSAFHSLEICQPLEAAHERCCVLLAAQNGLHGTSITGGGLTRIFDPALSMPNAFKKSPKIYHFVLHPLQKQLVILSTNAGVIVAKMSFPCLSSALPMPEPKTPKQSLELTCLRLKGGSLTQTEFMMVQQEAAEGEPVVSAPELLMDRELSLVSDVFGSGGHYKTSLSSCCKKLAITRTDANRFIIATNTGSSWIESFDSQGNEVVWNAVGDKIGVLDVPQSPTTTSQRSLSFGRQRSKTENSPTNSADTSPATVKIYRLGSAEPTDLDTDGSLPEALHGGPMLGVTFARRDGLDIKPFVFYSWETLLPCSDELSAPEWLVWSSNYSLCAFAYSTHILLFKVGEKFQPQSALPVRDPVHGLWRGDMLFVSTHDSVECIIVQRSKALHETDRVLNIQVIVLASFTSGPTWLTAETESPGYTQRPRPMGHLKILSASQGKLWLVDTRDRPFTIDIQFPGYLALTHAVEEHYVAARDAAIGKLSSDTLGQMFLTMGKTSAIEALKLPGLSLPLRLRTAIEAKYLKHALLCLQAITRGCRRPEAVVRLPEFIETLKDKPTTPTKSPVAGGPSASPFSMGALSSMPPMNLQSGLSGDSIDWELPLRMYTQKPPKRLSVDVNRETLELGIALHDAAVEERLYDIADAAAAIVTEHCDEIRNGDLLIQLEIRLSSREKTNDLKELSHLPDRLKKSCNGRLRGPVENSVQAA